MDNVNIFFYIADVFLFACCCNDSFSVNTTCPFFHPFKEAIERCEIKQSQDALEGAERGGSDLN